MRMMDAEEVARRLPYERLVPALHDAFADGAEVPVRHRHAVGGPDGDASLLLMPVWRTNEYLVVKLVTVFPANRERGMPGLSSVLVLFRADTGEQLALLDGSEITRRRTVGASALAARFLARPDAERLLVAGTGHIGGAIPAAYRAVRPISRVDVWNRTPESADRLVASLREDGLDAHRVDELAGAVAEADIVSCATMARTPILRGEWLRPGTHVDLIGSFKPTMRESDDEVLARASVFVDGPTALDEAGDLATPLAEGRLRRDDVRATLTQLCRGEHAGRESAEEITLFKSVGTAVEDLAAAVLAYRS
ncbi:MAG: ornithine cyclodeaminase family protein [Pseudonocardiaceae bacterium]|nr:ornithine cyclodeaminase family protein [Pseudonocardiaceae bacterium]